MVLRSYYPAEEQYQAPNMQYPLAVSPQPSQGNWGTNRPGADQYQGYPPTQELPTHPPRPYGASPGENSSYYGPPQQVNDYRPPPQPEYAYNGLPQPGYGYSAPPPASSQYAAQTNPQSYYSPPSAQDRYEYGSSSQGGSPYPPHYAAQEPSVPVQVKKEDLEGQPGTAPQTEEERGLMGALAGGAAGGYAGHKMHHGFLGTLGGAYAGHKLEDAYKDHKAHSKPPSPSPSHSPPPSYHHAPSSPLRGNFTASSNSITLDATHDLIASCTTISGSQHLSSISLNTILTNENGRFKWVTEGGNFGASAREVRLVEGGRVLEAELCDCRGVWRGARVVLDERVGNEDGELVLV